MSYIKARIWELKTSNLKKIFLLGSNRVSVSIGMKQINKGQILSTVSLHQRNTESRKRLEQKLYFSSVLLTLMESMNASRLTNLFI